MKDKTKGIVLISIAIIFVIISLTRTIFIKNITKDTKKITEEVETPSAAESVEEDTPTQVNNTANDTDYLTGEDLPDEYYINQEFKVVGLTDDLKNLVDHKTNELNIAIQEYLYLYGYVGLPQATIKEYTTISTSNQVLVTFTTGLKNEIILQAIFNMTDETWNITAL